MLKRSCLDGTRKDVAPEPMPFLIQKVRSERIDCH